MNKINSIKFFILFLLNIFLAFISAQPKLLKEKHNLPSLDKALDKLSKTLPKDNIIRALSKVSGQKHIKLGLQFYSIYYI